MNTRDHTGRRQALVGFGSNLGDRKATLLAVLDTLSATPEIAALARSRLFETTPVGLTEQPDFLNLVAGVETTLTPEALLDALQAIEARFGRVRDIRWGPRTLDLDLLAYESEIRATPALTLPHPRMLERAFVVFPLRDVLASPPFQRPVWDSLRRALARQLHDSDGVKPVGPE